MLRSTRMHCMSHSSLFDAMSALYRTKVASSFIQRFWCILTGAVLLFHALWMCGWWRTSNGWYCCTMFLFTNRCGNLHVDAGEDVWRTYLQSSHVRDVNIAVTTREVISFVVAAAHIMMSILSHRLTYLHKKDPLHCSLGYARCVVLWRGPTALVILL